MSALEIKLAPQEEATGAAAAGRSGPSSARLPPEHHVAAAELRDAPDEVKVATDETEYTELRKLTDLREPYHIPTGYLVGTKRFVGLQRAEAPLICFINAKSGGRVGPRLTTVLFHALGQGQVFDLAEEECRPGPVLRKLWDNLREAEAAGDAHAGHIRRNLRVLAAGGDGTVTWVLKTIHDLQLDPPPAVGVMPLGTGNDLSLSFGWGNAFLGKWIRSKHLYHTLERFAKAEVGLLDAWSITFDSPTPGLFSPQEMPYSLKAEKGQPSQVSGVFWNYFSVGLDAEAAYGFHRLRESKPWAASSRLSNQAWYAVFSCTSGWFCGAAPLVNKLRLRVKGGRGRGGNGSEGDWRDVALPKSVRALVLLNLQSYGGGRDIWGLSDSRRLAERGFSEPIFDDGLIEVVGLGSGWHTALVMGQVAPTLHAVRLAQCAEVELRLEASGGGRGVKGETGLTHMQLDGEPWAQQIPAAAEGQQPLRVHVRSQFKSRMLFNRDLQGGLGVKRIAKHGLEKGVSMRVKDSEARRAPSAPRSTRTERGSTATANGSVASDDASTA